VLVIMMHAQCKVRCDSSMVLVLCSDEQHHSKICKLPELVSDRELLGIAGWNPQSSCIITLHVIAHATSQQP
jgi:hypothetical protein